MDEFYEAVMLGRPSIHTGEWGLATMEVCLAIHQSAREQKEIFMHRQVVVPDRDDPDSSGLASTPSGLSNRERAK